MFTLQTIRLIKVKDPAAGQRTVTAEARHVKPKKTFSAWLYFKYRKCQIRRIP